MSARNLRALAKASRPDYTAPIKRTKPVVASSLSSVSVDEPVLIIAPSNVNNITTISNNSDETMNSYDRVVKKKRRKNM